MSDDEVDFELLELLKKSLGITPETNEITSETNVLSSAEYIYNNSIDIAIDRHGTVSAANLIWEEMQKRKYSRTAWSDHELHPKAKDESTVNFIFIMDLLNFSFWSERSEEDRFCVEYLGRKWTGYWSLVATLQRALEEGIPITTPSFWNEPTSESSNGFINGDQDDQNQQAPEPNGNGTLDSSLGSTKDPAMAPQSKPSHLTFDLFRHVFRSGTSEEIPLLEERFDCLQEAGAVLEENFNSSVVELIQAADSSAGKLVNLLAHHFTAFRDETKFDHKTVQIMKRPQILVADLWAAFDDQSYGHFHDIDNITMFADYRVPQMLHSLGCLTYSPSLIAAIKNKSTFPSGHPWEVQLRGNSIWAVELIRRHILREHPKASVNAILIDFFLYDLAKERERAGIETVPHHRTRSIWY